MTEKIMLGKMDWSGVFMLHQIWYVVVRGEIEAKASTRTEAERLLKAYRATTKIPGESVARA